MSAKVRRKAGGGSVDLQAADEVVRHVAVLCLLYTSDAADE